MKRSVMACALLLAACGPTGQYLDCPPNSLCPDTHFYAGPMPTSGLPSGPARSSSGRGALAQWKCAGPVSGCACNGKNVDDCAHAEGFGDTKGDAKNNALEMCAETRGDPRECTCKDSSGLTCERATWACDGPVRGCKKIDGKGPDTKDCPWVTGKGANKDDAIDDAKSECEVELDAYSCKDADVSGLTCAEEH